MQKRVENLYQGLSKKHKLPLGVIKAICESQFQCAREEIKKGISGEPETFKNVRFRNLGLLVSRPKKIVKIHETAGLSRDKIMDKGEYESDQEE